MSGEIEEADFRALMFSISGCPHCHEMKHVLEAEFGLRVVIVNLDAHPARKEDMRARCKKRTVPQLFFNERYVGNWKVVSGLAKSGELAALVQEFRGKRAGPDAPELPGPAEESPETTEETIECEPDADWTLVVRIRESLKVEQVREGLKTHKRVFRGSALRAWLQEHYAEEADSDAVCARLLAKNFFHPVKHQKVFEASPSFLCRFLQDEDSKALNLSQVSVCEPRAASQVAREMRQLILKLYDAHLSPDGSSVDYESMAASEDWQAYLTKATELQRVDLDGMTRPQALAFWINLYNALVIHATIELGPPKGAMGRTKFFATVSYQVGGYTFSTNDIEHGILRGNAVPPYSRKRLFSERNPRRKWSLVPGEPRVHFALNCGAQSCPPIKLFDESNVEQALTDATIAFFEEGGIVSKGKGNFELSSILKWYRADFGDSDASVLAWVHSFASEKVREDITETLDGGAKIKLTFAKYDWNTNSSK